MCENLYPGTCTVSVVDVPSPGNHPFDKHALLVEIEEPTEVNYVIIANSYSHAELAFVQATGGFFPSYHENNMFFADSEEKRFTYIQVLTWEDSMPVIAYGMAHVMLFATHAQAIQIHEFLAQQFE